MFLFCFDFCFESPGNDFTVAQEFAGQILRRVERE
jgi:hypothetical protein